MLQQHHLNESIIICPRQDLFYCLAYFLLKQSSSRCGIFDLDKHLLLLCWCHARACAMKGSLLASGGRFVGIHMRSEHGVGHVGDRGQLGADRSLEVLFEVGEEKFRDCLTEGHDK